MKKFELHWVTTGGLEEFFKIPISGYYLEAHGWDKNNLIYTKGEDVIRYNGTSWYLNGKEINSIIQIP